MTFRTFLNGTIWALVSLVVGALALYLLRYQLFESQIIAMEKPKQTYLLASMVIPSLIGVTVAIWQIKTVLGVCGGFTASFLEREYWQELSKAQVTSAFAFGVGFLLFEVFS